MLLANESLVMKSVLRLFINSVCSRNFLDVPKSQTVICNSFYYSYLADSRHQHLLMDLFQSQHCMMVLHETFYLKSVVSERIVAIKLAVLVKKLSWACTFICLKIVGI